MENLVLFTNSFLSYLLVFVVFVVVAAIGFILGKTLRKKKDLKEAALAETEQKTEE